MDNYFTSFFLTTTLELTTFGPKLCSRKIGYANALSLGTNSCEKEERDHFEQRSAGKAKKQCTCVVTKNKSRAVSIASSKSCQTNKDLFGVEIKLKESTFKDNNQINSTITTRSWGLSTEWTRTWPSAGLASKWKNGSGSLLIEWWILLVRVRGYCVVLTKIKAMSLCLFWLLEEMLSKQLFWNIKRKSNYLGAM